jgi:Mg2+/Co2+ transporter CorB
VFSGLPLWDKGLEGYAAHIIENSTWINEMKKIPNQGEFITIDNLKIVVKKKTQNRIKTLSVFVYPEQDEKSD